MSYGYISKVHLVDIDLERYALSCGIDADTYRANVQLAIEDIENHYSEMRKTFTTVNPERIARQITFKDESHPSGPYELHVRYQEKFGKGLRPFRRREIIFGFSKKDDASVFEKYIFKFTTIRNALQRYYQLVDDASQELRTPRGGNLQFIISSDLRREKGHKGIVASLFPLNFNYHLLHEREKAAFEIDMGVASNIFALFRALFPKASFDNELDFDMKPLPVRPPAPDAVIPQDIPCQKL